MSTSILKALPGNLDIKRHSPSILFILEHSVALDIGGLLDRVSLVYP